MFSVSLRTLERAPPNDHARNTSPRCQDRPERLLRRDHTMTSTTITNPTSIGSLPPGNYYFRLPEEEQIALFKEWFARAAGKRVVWMAECYDYHPPKWAAQVVQVPEEPHWWVEQEEFDPSFHEADTSLDEYLSVNCGLVSVTVPVSKGMLAPIPMDYSFLPISDDVSGISDVRSAANWDKFEDWLCTKGFARQRYVVNG